jgi:hypothetical protein
MPMSPSLLHPPLSPLLSTLSSSCRLVTAPLPLKTSFSSHRLIPTPSNTTLGCHSEDYSLEDHCVSPLSLTRPDSCLVDGGSLHEMMQFLHASLSTLPPPLPLSAPPLSIDSPRTSRGSSERVSDPPKKVLIHPAIASEINRSLFHSHQQQGGESSLHKRRWEDERDQLLRLIEERELVCIDLNKLSYQQANPLLLNITGGTSASTLLPLHSKFVFGKREQQILVDSKGGDQFQFQVLRWRDYCACDDLTAALTRTKPPSSPPALNSSSLVVSAQGKDLGTGKKRPLGEMTEERSVEEFSRRIKIEPKEGDLTNILGTTETQESSSVIDLTYD